MLYCKQCKILVEPVEIKDDGELYQECPNDQNLCGEDHELTTFKPCIVCSDPIPEMGDDWCEEHAVEAIGEFRDFWDSFRERWPEPFAKQMLRDFTEDNSF